MALIPSKCTNSSCEAAQTTLSQTAPNIVKLALLLPTLCILALALSEGTNSMIFTV